MTTAFTLSQHSGEQERTLLTYHDTTIRAYGDRSSTSAMLNFGFESLNDEWIVQPFILAGLSYVHQGSLDENGYPAFTLDFDSRDTWWINLEAGLKYEKVFIAKEEVDYLFDTAGVVTFLANLSDEEQRFTYHWGSAYGIGSSDEPEPGLALRLGLKRKPKDPNKMRIELAGSAGYQAEVFTYSGMLNFVFPFGE